MFGVKVETIDVVALRRDLKDEALRDVKSDHEREIAELKHDHKLELKGKQFELDHQESEQVKKLEGEKVELEQKVAVLEKQVEMMDQITDLNADIIDVKDVINKLIEKLPSIDIKSLTTGGNSDK